MCTCVYICVSSLVSPCKPPPSRPYLKPIPFQGPTYKHHVGVSFSPLTISRWELNFNWVSEINHIQTIANVCTWNQGEWDEDEKHRTDLSQGQEESRSPNLPPAKPCFYLNRKKNGGRCPFLWLFISCLRSEPVTDKRQSSSKHSSKPRLYKGLNHQVEALDVSGIPSHDLINRGEVPSFLLCPHYVQNIN